MKRRSSYLLLACWLGLSSLTAAAQHYALQPGESIAVNFIRVRLLEKGTPLIAARNVSATAKFTLDQTGTVLTVSLQNLSLPDCAAALYALDLGLAKKLAVQTQGKLTAGNFPPKAVWLGPTDNESLTYGNGAFTIAAREAILGEMRDFTDNLGPLPAGFLSTGQHGSFTIKLTFAEGTKASTLRFSPVAYFVAPDSRSTTPRRLRLAVFGQGATNNAR